MIETAKHMHPSIGTIGTVLLEGLAVSVRVVDMRQRWGTVDALIRPIEGHGEKWIEARRVTVNEVRHGDRSGYSAVEFSTRGGK